MTGLSRWSVPLEADATASTIDRLGRTVALYGRTAHVKGDRVELKDPDHAKIDTLGDGFVTTPLLMPDGSTPPSWIRRRVCRGNRMWMQFEDRRVWCLLEPLM